MKKLKDIILKMTLVTVLSASAALGGDGGSTGTRDGGDDVFDLNSLLPRSLTISETHKHGGYRDVEAIVIGEKYNWGFWPATIYAWQYVYKLDFDLEKFMRNGRGASVKVYGKKGSLEKELDKATLRKNINKKHELTDEVTIRGLLSYYITEAYQIQYDSPYNDDSFSKSIVWDEQELTDYEYVAKNDAIVEATISQLDFNNPATVIKAKTPLKYFENIEAANALVYLKNSINDKLQSQYLVQHEEIMALAKQVIDEQTGSCDEVKYEQLRSKLRGFEFGTRRWFKRLLRETGMDLSAETFSAERGAIYAYYNEEIEPFCSLPASKPVIEAPVQVEEQPIVIGE